VIIVLPSNVKNSFKDLRRRYLEAGLDNLNLGACMIRKEDYDLMGMVIIRLGDKEYSEEVGILKFLNLIMYPGRKTLVEDLSEFINFKENKELEVKNMRGLCYSILEEGRKEGIQIAIRILQSC